jgi:hypothetical protein
VRKLVKNVGKAANVNLASASKTPLKNKRENNNF